MGHKAAKADLVVVEAYNIREETWSSMSPICWRIDTDTKSRVELLEFGRSPKAFATALNGAGNATMQWLLRATLGNVLLLRSEVLGVCQYRSSMSRIT